MTRRSFSYAMTFVAATWMISYAAPVAHAETKVIITNPTSGDGIPEDPGSIGTSGNYLNSRARSITVSIYKAQLVNGTWAKVGAALSSGSTTVSGTTFGSLPWSANLNSPATSEGVDYVLEAVSKDINGNTLDTSDLVHVISD